MNELIARKVQEIREALRKKGAWQAICYLTMKDLLYTAETITTINWREKISFQEICLLSGILAESEFSNPQIDARNVHVLAKELKRLCGELHDIYKEAIFSDLFSEPNLQNLSLKEAFGSSVVMQELIFYGGSLAYDIQYVEFASQIYRRDDEWLKANVGLSIEDIVLAGNAAWHVIMFKINTQTSVNPDKLNPQQLTDIFSISPAELTILPEEKVKIFLDLFSLQPESGISIKRPAEYNPVEAKPFIRIEEEKYLAVNLFGLPKAIFHSPFHWMNDDKSYADKLATNRSKGQIEIAKSLIENNVKDCEVYESVTVTDPANSKKRGNTKTDIDLLVVKGNRAIVFQAKTKMMTKTAQDGDPVKILEDFNIAIQKAYDQGVVSKNGILSESMTLTSEEHGVISLHERIKEVYIVCLTLSPYPGGNHQVSVMLNKEESETFPLVWSIFDLEVIAHYLNDPFDFFYYIYRRTALVEKVKAESEDELTYLAYHLKTKLPPHLEENSNLLIGSDFVQLVDANFMNFKGRLPQGSGTERIFSTWKNDDFDTLIRSLKEGSAPDFMDAVFMLYDIAGVGADDFINAVKKTKRYCLETSRGKNVSLLFLSGKFGISYCCAPSITTPRGQLENEALRFAELNKYKHKCDFWLGFSGYCDIDSIAISAIFNNKPWEENSEMEQLTAELLGKQTVEKIGNKIGRNDPCPCGKRKDDGARLKFKHCHGT